MIKTVRIENADTTNIKVEVELWEKGASGKKDVRVSTSTLHYPTSMVSIDLTSTRYAIIREAVSPPKTPDEPPGNFEETGNARP